MNQKMYFPMTLIAIAILSGCSSMPQNSSLADAHVSYNSARSDPKITSLAPMELKEASDTLNKADTALTKGESDAIVNQLAYMAKQQVGIAQETAKRKTAELAVTNADAKRDQVRLDARTAEADAAKQKIVVVQATADQQAAALIAAKAKADSDQALLDKQDMQLKELNAKKTDRGMVITLSDVLFSTNKAELASGGVRDVQKLADFLKQYPKNKVLIEGYTDSVGSESLNQALSDRRAGAVSTALLNTGISSDRVATHGYGESFPVASNDTASGRQLNRRVEIILSDENGTIKPR